MDGVDGMRLSGSDLPSDPPRWARSFSARAIVPLYTVTLFVAAFLLFGLQPMFTKRVLPVLGGTPAVWSVAMVVFQALLLAGYAYAHALTRWLPLRAAMATHALVLLVGFVSLPIAVASGFEAPPADAEAVWLVGLFLASIGLPFFALSASAPLLQAWFARSGAEGARDPYFLYRASNIGSFSALLAYPLLIEPLLGLDAQAQGWSLGYGLLACAVLVCAVAVRDGRAALPASPVDAGSVPGAARRLAWIGLSAVPSGLLVAATAHISTDVAAIPLMWVVPLALYLLSFVFAFRPGGAWPGRRLALLQLLGTAAALMALLFAPAPIWFDLPVTLGLLMVTLLIAHRTLFGLRPAAARLTDFYLCTSFGGMLGGLFAALVAPRIFAGIYEYPILLVAALACRPGLLAGGLRALAVEARRALAIGAATGLGAWLVWATQPGSLWTGALTLPLCVALLLSSRAPIRALALGTMLGLACLLLPVLVQRDGESHRSFFGVHRVQSTADGRFRLLYHGTTLHGAMRIRDDAGAPVAGPPEPTTYYAEGGPMADILDVARRAHGPSPTVSVVGLGAGSLACHARAGESWTFFEIDPSVIRIASDPAKFRFLSECAPGATIVQGDARLTLAARRRAARILIVDAFSSDAIPMHLLTREALDIDLAHLDETGVLALHISNRHFELRHVLARLAAERGLALLHREEPEREPFAKRFRTRSDVVVLTRDPAIAREAAALGWTRIAPDMSRVPWSDDYANAIEAMIDRVRLPADAGTAGGQNAAYGAGRAP